MQLLGRGTSLQRLPRTLAKLVTMFVAQMFATRVVSGEEASVACISGTGHEVSMQRGGLLQK